MYDKDIELVSPKGIQNIYVHAINYALCLWYKYTWVTLAGNGIIPCTSTSAGDIYAIASHRHITYSSYGTLHTRRINPNGIAKD